MAMVLKAETTIITIIIVIVDDEWRLSYKVRHFEKM